jgi:hypothetical protein
LTWGRFHNYMLQVWKDRFLRLFDI